MTKERLKTVRKFLDTNKVEYEYSVTESGMGEINLTTVDDIKSICEYNLNFDDKPAGINIYGMRGRIPYEVKTQKEVVDALKQYWRI